MSDVGSVVALGVFVFWQSGVLLVSRWVFNIGVGGGVLGDHRQLRLYCPVRLQELL